MHELDKQVGDILQHYGIKGMRWTVRRSPEEIAEDAQAGVDALGEALEDAGDEVMGNDSILEELGDVIDVAFGGKGNLKKETKQLQDAIKDKMEDVGKDIKKRGERIAKMFGSTKKTTITTYINGRKISSNRTTTTVNKQSTKKKKKFEGKGLFEGVDKSVLRKR